MAVLAVAEAVADSVNYKEKIMKIISSIFLALWLFISFVSADVIKNYHVDITVLEDGKIDVIETIAMDIDHEDIRLGIIRDIPEYYSLYKKLVHTPVNVLSVTRNGKPENYWIERRNNKAEVFTGAKENIAKNYIPLGENVYVIHWTSPNHIRGFVDYDELYLNAIGNDWEFPIEKASVTLHLPSSVKAMQSAGYYGYRNSRNKADVIQVSPTEINFTVPSSIGNGQGLTVATGFTKGIIPSEGIGYLEGLVEKALMYLPSYTKPLHIVLGFVVVSMFIYWCIGFVIYKLRLPRSKRAFMVRFSPPNLPLDQIIVLADKGGPDYKKAQLSMLMDLVYKKILIFHKSIMMFEINHKQLDILKDQLTTGQLACLSELDLRLDGKAFYRLYNPYLESSLNQLSASLMQYVKQFYQSVVPFFGLGGFVLFIICIVLTKDIIGFEMYLLMLFPLVGTALLWGALVRFFRGLTIWNVIPRIFGSVFLVMFGAVFSFMPLVMLWGDFNNTNNLYASILVVIILLLFCAVISLYGIIGNAIKPQYIDEEQQVLEFKHFLRYTKEAEYKIISPDVFEEYLSYAIAFGVDQHWLKMYQKIYPQEYDNSYRSGSVSINTITTSRAFTSATTARRSSGSGSSSSSGSGGGGSSGGGSGGGGGRGR